MSDVDVRAVGFTARGHRALRDAVPPGVRASGVPVPARALRASWRRVPFPPIELLAGRGDVVHGTNFVLPPSVRARVAVEAGIAQSWYRFVKDAGEIVSIEHFGASADYKTLFEKFGFTTGAVTDAARRSLDNARSQA